MNKPNQTNSSPTCSSDPPSDTEKQLNWLKLRKKANQVFRVALPLLDNALEFRKMPGLLSGMRFALHAKNAIESVYSADAAESPNWFQGNQSWCGISSAAFQKLLIGSMTRQAGVFTQFAQGDSRNNWLEWNGSVYGVFNKTEEAKLLYVEKNDTLAWKKLIDLFWSELGGQGLVRREGTHDDLVIGPFEQQGSHRTDLTEKYTQEIRQFKEKGYSRSLLIYGPPGTGKSNMAAQILRDLECRTLIFNDIVTLEPSWIREHLDLFQVEAVVIEDLDHMQVDKVNKILDSLQFMCQRGMLVLATCNKILELPDAMIRPGRFDECVLVNCLPESVVLEMIRGAEDLLETVRDFSISNLIELRRRLEVLGREETIRRMKDLEQRHKRSQPDAYQL